MPRPGNRVQQLMRARNLRAASPSPAVPQCLKPAAMMSVSGHFGIMLATMPRTTLIGSLPGEPIDDTATMQDFVRLLVEIAVADYTAEQLFADAALNDCLRLILAKNRGLHDFGGT